jgi:hypothetical protein
MIDENTAEKCVLYLQNTADEYGQRHQRVVYLRERAKIVEAIAFEDAPKGAVDTKKMAARASQEYQDAIEELSIAEGEFITLKSSRDAAAAKLSLYQSLLKAKSQGVIL